MKEKKRQLRNEMKEKLNSVTDHMLEEKSAQITNQILQLLEWKKAKTIGITLPIQKEVNTHSLIEKGWSEGKTISVPKVEPKMKRMSFYQINDFTKLVKNKYGILEPSSIEQVKVDRCQIDLLIIPCLAFDEKCYRLGYGGGYYDRFLVDYKGISCGIAFECQKVQAIPIDRYDIALNMIVTEENIYT